MRSFFVKNISYTLYNSFFGKTIGGFGTTNIFLICVSYIYLSTRIHYKKEIPLYSLITYIITGIIYLLITKSNISNITNEIITTNILFAFVYIATIPHYSTATKEGTIIYSIRLNNGNKEVIPEGYDLYCRYLYDKDNLITGIQASLVIKDSNVTLSNFSKNINVDFMKVLYSTHIQNIGWQNYVKDGEISGTSGKALRLEAIKIKIENQSGLTALIFLRMY